MGVSKSFGTNITENHQDNLFALSFGQELDQILAIIYCSLFNGFQLF